MKYILILFALLLGCGKGGSEPTYPGQTYPSKWEKFPIPVITPTRVWEQDNINDGSVLLVNGTYYRFYCAGNSRMDVGYATSSVNDFPYFWDKTDNSIISAAALGFVSLCAPRVIAMLDGTYRMYVHAFDGTRDRGHLFVSTNFPDQWVIANDGNPIFSEGPAGTWDSYQIQTQAFIPSWESPDGLWHQFYIGTDGSTFRGGHATSVDGISWDRNINNPIMVPDHGWKSRHIAPLGFYKTGNTFNIVIQGYDGYQWSVGIYKTNDLYNLTPDSSPTISGTPGAWDSSGIEGVDVITDTNGVMWAFYLGSNIPNDHRGGNKYRMGVAKVIP